MDREPLDRLPEEVTVPGADARAVVAQLDRLRGELERQSHPAAEALEEIVGRMTRWIWPLLGELDEEEGYDG